MELSGANPCCALFRVMLELKWELSNTCNRAIFNIRTVVKMQFFLNTTGDLRLEIQPALKLSSVSGTFGAIAKVIHIPNFICRCLLIYYHDEPIWPWKGKEIYFSRLCCLKKLHLNRNRGNRGDSSNGVSILSLWTYQLQWEPILRQVWTLSQTLPITDFSQTILPEVGVNRNL